MEVKRYLLSMYNGNSLICRPDDFFTSNVFKFSLYFPWAVLPQCFNRSFYMWVHLTNRQRALYSCFHGIVAHRCCHCFHLSMTSRVNVIISRNVFFHASSGGALLCSKKSKLIHKDCLPTVRRHLCVVFQQTNLIFPVLKKKHRLNQGPKKITRRTLLPLPKRNPQSLHSKRISVRILKQLNIVLQKCSNNWAKPKKNELKIIPPKSSRFPKVIPLPFR